MVFKILFSSFSMLRLYMCVYINRHIYYFQRVDTISQEFMLMVERYPRLLVQDQADHIHALGWEFLARYIYI